MKKKEILKEILEESKLITAVVVIITLCMTLALSVINYFNTDDTRENAMFLVMFSNSTEEFVFESGYGFNRCVEKAKEDKITVINSYNESAGNINNWNGEMTLEEFNLYSNSLGTVNGNIVNTEVLDDYMYYTYSNGEKLKVHFKKTSDIKEYVITKNSESQYNVSEEEGYTKHTYEDGYVEVLEVVKGEEAKVIAVEFSIKTFIRDMCIMVIPLTIFSNLLMATFVTVNMLEEESRNKKEERKSKK